MNNILLSVIIPAYQSEQSILSCLEVIDVQNSKQLEIIVVNDGSTDNTENILKQCSTRIDNLIVLSESNSGASSARNKGLEVATGKYIWFVDADDQIAEGAIEYIFQAVERSPEIDMFKFPYTLVNGSGENRENQGLSQYYLGKTFQGFHLIAGFLNQKIAPAPWSNVCKRAVYQSCNLRFEPGVYFEDTVMTTNLLLNVKHVKCLESDLYQYHVTGGSITNSCNQNHILSLFKILNLIKTSLESNDLFCRNITNFFYFYWQQIYHNLSIRKEQLTGALLTNFIAELDRSLLNIEWSKYQFLANKKTVALVEKNQLLLNELGLKLSINLIPQRFQQITASGAPRIKVKNAVYVSLRMKNWWTNRGY